MRTRISIKKGEEEKTPTCGGLNSLHADADTDGHGGIAGGHR